MSEFLSPPSIQALLLFRLATSNPHFNESEYFEKFREFNTNLDRVNYVYKDLEKYKLFPMIIDDENGKNDSKSRDFREEGNQAFGEGDFKTALRLYTMSIATAENAKWLGLGYANRSAALYKLERYQLCMMDIERALANHYPHKLRPKLIARRQNAEGKLNSSSPLKPYHQDIPQLSAADKHPEISSANKCVKIATSEQDGRHIVATRDIQIGEILCVEKPYTASVFSDRTVFCHTCLELCYNPIPCDKCIFLVFCSENCKSQACDTFHKYECSTLSNLLSRGLNITDLVAVRAALLARQEKSTELAQDELYRSDRFKEIAALKTGVDKLKLEKLYNLSVTAAFIFYAFMNCSFIFNCPNNKVVKDQFKENILSQLLILELNRMPIYVGIQDFDEWIDETCAYGLYSFASLFNHSCSPNVDTIQYGSTTVLRAVNTIKKGQQCCVTYGPTYWNANRIERFFSLKKSFLFDCKCPACLQNWSVREDLFNSQFPLFPRMNPVEILLMAMELRTSEPTMVNKYLPLLIRQLKSCEHFEPWGNVLRIKKMICFSYKVFGNRRAF